MKSVAIFYSWYPLYKCKRCGEEFSDWDGTTYDEDDNIMKTYVPPTQAVLHKCNDKQIGTTEFIGYDYMTNRGW